MRGPLLQQGVVGFDEVFFHELALFNGQLATFFSIINNSSQ